MFDVKVYKDKVQERMETSDEAFLELARLFDETAEYIGENMDGFVKYMKTDMTEDEYSWLSEITDEICLRFPNNEFVAALKFLAEKYPEETEKYDIVRYIEEAEEIVKEELAKQQ